MRRAQALLWLGGVPVLLVGCTLGLNGLGTPGVDAGPRLDAGPPIDAGTGDAGPGIDAGDGDAGPAIDGGDGDAGPGGDAGPASTCPIAVDGDTVALFTFEGVAGTTTIPEATGTHPGRVLDGSASTVAGPVGCGDALDFPAGNRSYVAVADSPAWDLTEGSIDFYVLLRGMPSREVGLIARDASSSGTPGHLRVSVNPMARVIARLQDPAGDRILRFEPVPTDRWVHVGLNFGPGGYELWIDGSRRARVTNDVSINGNDNPFLIGADNSGSIDGADPPTLLRRLADDLAMDQVRISSARRDFSPFAP